MFGLFQKQQKAETPAGAAGNAGFGAPLHLAFDQRRLPNGGAMSVAFETLALPRYTPIGWGVANRKALRFGQQVGYQLQGVTLNNAGGPGILTGAFITQPLLDNSDPATRLVQVADFPSPQSYSMPNGRGN